MGADVAITASSDFDVDQSDLANTLTNNLSDKVKKKKRSLLDDILTKADQAKNDTTLPASDSTKKD